MPTAPLTLMQPVVKFTSTNSAVAAGKIGFTSFQVDLLPAVEK
jgi:hypothetical protein